MAEHYLQEVRDQYEQMPYPPRNPEEERLNFTVPFTEWFPRMNHFCYAGKRTLDAEFRPLVAGGGTGDAAIALAEQLFENGGRVTYLDFSTQSLNIAKKRAEIRGLTNIDFIHSSIMDIPKLGLAPFDFINCCGVLHHLEDPDAGLQVLSSALKEDGALSLMLYGTYGRHGVYLLQDALRRIHHDITDAEQKLRYTKALLAQLPSSHWFLHSDPYFFDELKMGDAGIYDLLLHSQDRSYTIPEIYGFLDKAGLRPVQFFYSHPTYGNAVYDPASYIGDAALRAQVQKLPEPEQQALAELLFSKIGNHSFYATKKPCKKLSAADGEYVLFMDGALGEPVDNSLYRAIHQFVKAQPIGSSCTLSLSGIGGMTRAIQLQISPFSEPFWRFLDGMRSIQQITQLIQNSDEFRHLEPSPEKLLTEIDAQLDAFIKHDALWMRHSTLPPYKPKQYYQKRMLERTG